MDLKQVAQALKVIGGSVTALAGAAAGAQVAIATFSPALASNPKIALYTAAAGLVLHGAATAMNEASALILRLWAIFHPGPTDATN